MYNQTKFDQNQIKSIRMTMGYSYYLELTRMRIDLLYV